jgi:arylsulfatase
VFSYSGVPVTGLPRGTSPGVLNTSCSVAADIEVPVGGAEGMIVTDGGRFGEDGLRLLKGRPAFVWSLLDLERVRWESGEALSPGKHRLECVLRYDGPGYAALAFNDLSGVGRPGAGTFRVDGKVVGAQTLKRTIPMAMPWDETCEIGSDTGAPVDDRDYKVPFRLTGRIDKLVIAVDPPQLTPGDVRKLREVAARAADCR